MRDTIRDVNYFEGCIAHENKILNSVSEILKTLPKENEQGRKNSYSTIGERNKNLLKILYSAGYELEEIYSYYKKWVMYYSMVCTSGGLYDVVDMLAIGVLFDKRKSEFIDDIREVVRKKESKDGLLLCLYDYLEGKTGDYKPSKIYKYFNELPESNEKEKVLGEAIKKWYQQHKSAYWYGTHKTESSYHGYWCFEVAALVKIFGVDDTAFKDHKYYPYDMLHNDL